MEPGLNPAMFTAKFLPRLWWGSSLLPILDAGVGSVATSALPRCPLHPLGTGADEVPLCFPTLCSAQVLTAPPMKRCCDSIATTSRLPWGPAWSPGLGSGTPLDVISGELPSGRVLMPPLSSSF